MQYKSLALAAILATVSAQESNGTANLTSALGSNPELSNLTQFLGILPAEFTAGLAQLQNVTLLAPNNQAFSEFLNSSAGSALTSGGNNTALIQGILQYHVLNGTYSSFAGNVSFVPTSLQPPQFTNVTGGQRVEVIPGSDGAANFLSGLLSNSSTVGNATNFTGGVIHVIDHFLIPPQNITETAVQANLTAAVGAITKAKLGSALDSLSDVTVFVPDNEAFQGIGNLLANLSETDLTSILEYHVVNGTVGYSTDLTNGSMLMSMNGMNLTITVESDGAVFVNSARVTVPNVLVANGVVHVIDGVLNPANTTAAPMPSNTGDSSPAFAGASSGEIGGLTSGVPTPTATVNPTSAASAATSSSSSGAAGPMFTGAIGPAALFGGAALFANL